MQAPTTVLIGCVVALAGASAPGQSILRTHIGVQSFDTFGTSIAGRGDLDHDGTPDLLVGAVGFSGATPGYVTGFSGATGIALFTILAPGTTTDFGRSVSIVGDLNADGKDDIIVGAPNEAVQGVPILGRVRVYSSATQAVLFDHPGLATWKYTGRAVSRTGDVNGDGVPDYAFGFRDDATMTNGIRICSGATGATILTASLGAQGADPDGVLSIDDIGDANGDGVPDVLAVAGITTKVFSGANGAVLYSYVGGGRGAALHGDLNNDGRADFIMLPISTYNQSLAPVVRSGANGTPLLTPDNIGSVTAGVGDFDGDGHPDLAVGDPQVYGGGLMMVLSGAVREPLLAMPGNFSNGWEAFGTGVAGVGDMNGDGRADCAVSAPGAVSATGRVVVFAGGNRIKPVGSSCWPSGPRPQLVVAGTLTIGSTALVEISSSTIGSPVSYLAASTVPAASTSFPHGCLVWVDPNASVTFALIALVYPNFCTGSAALGLTVQIPAAPVNVGAQVALQGLSQVAPFGAFYFPGGYNITNAVYVTIGP